MGVKVISTYDPAQMLFSEVQAKTSQMVSLFPILQNSGTVNIRYDRSEQRSALTTFLVRGLYSNYSNWK